ncbi:proto-oncogene tyrosine-protein kinase receptor Ret isoform X2 [Belonocnema kinseyi]|uniref:proto-oncogene tyrosine-protein kinase receptor Ret isoform X2 n=1 Tax=Belonocnema kinseyi TaxID=2817044 RepID=UPI00143D7977|nr:proto-oncogene tyrosine-protein kinase receptor Ret isoform X2 [Belonocnema kinseyi]
MGIPIFIFYGLFTVSLALYFPQSDFMLRIPYLAKNGVGLSSDMKLITVRALRNDSTSPKDPKYQIVLPREKIASLDSETGSVVLHTLPKEGTGSAIIVQGKERSGEGASLEIKVEPVLVENGMINCTDYLEDMCYWHETKYRIYENQPITMLGSFGPEIYKGICPDFHVTRYELLNGTQFFHVEGNVIFSNASLDRDSKHTARGTGAHVDVEVRCVIWERQTGFQHAMERTIGIDILDQDDNPPVDQLKGSLEIQLTDFTLGDRLDKNELMVKDADAISSNRYTVQILGDIYHAFNITYDTLPVDIRTDVPPSTAIYTRIYSRTTLLPKSPYKVILQVKDESLQPGYGDNSVNITLIFVGPQHHTTTSTTSFPVRQQILYPESTKIARISPQYLRVAQPSRKPSPGTLFSLSGSKAFNITRKGGIVYVSSPNHLQTQPSTFLLKIEWRTADNSFSSTQITIHLFDVNSRRIGEPCGTNQTTNMHSCANAKSKKECETRCGVGSGLLKNNAYTDECTWRLNNANSPGATMTERYETCSPDLNFCPDHICDELEVLDHRICPQDCTIESEVHFAEVNKGGRGIRSGLGICWCNDMVQCTCGSFPKGNGGRGGSGGWKEEKEGPKYKKDRDITPVVSDARKASNGPCGPTCLIGVVGSSFFVLIIIVGTFVMWRMAMKGSRRDCKHRRENGTTGLGILPSDYIDRGDGLLIGLDSLAGVNRTLLIPKSSPPDPKWEFPRTRLTIEQVLGEGEFGRVLRAKAMDISGWTGLTTVAVKTLKEDACASELADLLSEYQLLKEVQHPNVIRLLGACTSPDGPVYLIIEFAEFGSLRNYLRRSRHLESEGRVPCSTSLLSSSPNNITQELQTADSTSNYAITPRDILSFAWQISKGMAYLADIKLVHRDLAARNVLLAAGKVCKISDFGLTRDVYEDDAYLKRSKGRVPVKWMAPESLADHVYTSKSDVWSFGVLLWELVTLGASPYPGVDVHNLYNLLKAGYRMERPANCSPQLYKLMVSCWHEEAGMRPSFKELTFQWERMLEDGVEYLDLNPRTVHNQAYFASLHALDSPTSKPNSSNDAIPEGTSTSRALGSNAVNYLSKPSFEPVAKSDKVDKLHTLWQSPIASFPEEYMKSPYENDRPTSMNINHYESPIKFRNSSVTSNSENELTTPTNERPQSYIDMQGRKSVDQEDLLFFNNIENKLKESKEEDSV